MAQRVRRLGPMLNQVLLPFGLRLSRPNAPLSLQSHRLRLSQRVFDLTRGTIQAGPLRGCILSGDLTWDSGSLGAILLGAYEQQIHGAIEDMIATHPDLVVNIGAADGLYSVGLARRLPNTRVVAIDIDSRSAGAVWQTARMNDVHERVECRLNPTLPEIEALLSDAERPAMFVDCEGAEVNYLDPSRIPSLGKTTIIVEVHEHLQTGLSEILHARFSATHDLEVIRESGRNPHDYEMLQEFSSHDGWLMMSEGRPCEMSWMSCVPRRR